MEWTIHIDGGPRRVNHAAVCVGAGEVDVAALLSQPHVLLSAIPKSSRTTSLP